MSILGIIPAAGFGQRLGLPYPKEILPITLSASKDKVITSIETSIIQMADAGIEECLIILRPHKQMISQHLGTFRHGVRLTYTLQNGQTSREGLPDALRCVEKQVDLYVMLMADTYFSSPLIVTRMLDAINSDPAATLVLASWLSNQPQRFGVLRYNQDETEYPVVTEVKDKPTYLQGTFPVWGAAAWRPGFQRYIHDEIDTFSNAANRCAYSHRVLSVPCEGEFMDIGTPQSYIDSFIRINQ